jgi:hypothetical protein
MSTTKRALIAFAIAVATEAVLLVLVALFNDGGEESPIPILYMLVHLPGYWLIDLLTVAGVVSSAFILLTTGILQFTLLYWLAIVVWGAARNRRPYVPRPSSPAPRPHD